MVQTDTIGGCVAASESWEKRRDLPDIVDLEDYRKFSSVSSRLIQRELALGFEPDVEAFPYPKWPTGVRTFVVGNGIAELTLRYLVSAVIPHIDRALSTKVVNYRLAVPPPAWHCHPPDISGRRENAVRRIQSDDFEGMGIFDVRSFYPSIDVEVLGELLVAIDADEAVVRRLCDALVAFVDSVGLGGIPIGPEASGPLGNAYLLPIDAELQSMGVDFYRLTDDVWTFATLTSPWSAILSRVDVVIEALGLELAKEKTDFFPQPVDAIRYVTDALISATDGWLEFGRDVGVEVLRIFVDTLEDDPAPTPRRFRFAMNRSRALSDMYAVEVLTRRTDLLETDPRSAGDYLRTAARKKRRYVEPLLPYVEKAPAPRTEAVHLHLLRALSVRPWGRPEADLFEKIFRDVARPVLSRAWALLAHLRARPRIPAADAVDIAVDSDQPLTIRRAAVLGLNRLSEVDRRKCCRHIAGRCKELVPAARLVEDAA